MEPQQPPIQPNQPVDAQNGEAIPPIVPSFTPTNDQTTTPPPPKTPNKLLLLVGGIVALVAIAGAVFFFLNKDETTSSSSSSNNSSQDADDELQVDDETLNTITNKEVSDLTWKYTQPGSGWNELAGSTGIVQFQLSDTRCVVTLNQPAGMKDEAVSSGSDVVDGYTNQLAQTLNETDQTVLNQSSKFFQRLAKSDTTTSSVKFDGKRAYFNDADATVQTYAYLNGDFALVVMASCGGNDFDTYYDTKLQPFIESLRVNAVY